jgi:hypothetical protein
MTQSRHRAATGASNSTFLAINYGSPCSSNQGGSYLTHCDAVVFVQEQDRYFPAIWQNLLHFPNLQGERGQLQTASTATLSTGYRPILCLPGHITGKRARLASVKDSASTSLKRPACQADLAFANASISRKARCRSALICSWDHEIRAMCAGSRCATAANCSRLRGLSMITA